MMFNYGFLLIGVFVNAVLLYGSVTAFAPWLSVKTGTQPGKF